MPPTTLLSFLRAHRDNHFIFRGQVVDTQHLVNHYSAYLDAQVAVDGAWVFFVTSRGREPAPFAFRVPVRLEGRRAA